jgi:hypothetical protein
LNNKEVENLHWQYNHLRDRPFNLQGGYGFWFRSEFFFRTTQELEYLFFCPEFNIKLYDKNSESDYLFFTPPKSEYFFQQHWESEYFFSIFGIFNYCLVVFRILIM